MQGRRAVLCLQCRCSEVVCWQPRSSRAGSSNARACGFQGLLLLPVCRLRLVLVCCRGLDMLQRAWYVAEREAGEVLLV